MMNHYMRDPILWRWIIRASCCVEPWIDKAVFNMGIYMLPWPWFVYNKGVFVLAEKPVIELCNKGDKDERWLWIWYWIAVYDGFAKERMRFRWKLRVYSIWQHINDVWEYGPYNKQQDIN